MTRKRFLSVKKSQSLASFSEGEKGGNCRIDFEREEEATQKRRGKKSGKSRKRENWVLRGFTD